MDSTINTTGQSQDTKLAGWMFMPVIFVFFVNLLVAFIPLLAIFLALNFYYPQIPLFLYIIAIVFVLITIPPIVYVLRQPFYTKIDGDILTVLSLHGLHSVRLSEVNSISPKLTFSRVWRGIVTKQWGIQLSTNSHKHVMLELSDVQYPKRRELIDRLLPRLNQLGLQQNQQVLEIINSWSEDKS